jgi:uncharacterized repeat protein (TIGR02543 family)
MISACTEANDELDVTLPEDGGKGYKVLISSTPNDAGSVSVDPSRKVEKGTPVALTVTKKTGYKFAGLTVTTKTGDISLSSSEPPYTFTMPGADVTVRVVFVEVEAGDPTGGLYSVTIKTGDNGSVSASSAYAVEGTPVTLTVSPSMGFKLKETSLTVTGASESPVEVTGSGNKYTFTMPKENVTVRAEFEELPPGQYTVSVDSGLEHGSIGAAVNEDSATSAKENYTVTLTVTPAEGYQLDSGPTVTKGGGGDVTVSGSGPYTFTMPAENVTVTAQFTPITYTVAYDGNASGVVGSTTSSTHTYDVEKALTANGFSRTGYNFTGWNTASGGGGTSYTAGQSVTNLSSTNNETVTLYAQWTAIQYTVTFNADGGSPDIQTKKVNSGASVSTDNMPAEPTKANYTFGGWYTQQSGGGTQFTALTTVAADITVYAKWTAVPGSTTIPINNPGSVIPSGWNYSSSSSTVTITTTGNYTIIGTTTANRVVVAANVTANITLNGVSIDVSGVSNACAFYITPGAVANITLASGATNTLKSNGQSAGLQAPAGATLSIASAAGPGSTNGTLDVYAGATGAGLGGGNGQIGGTITITGGTVKATSYNPIITDAGAGGAAIGGGSGAAGGSITISGGAVTATGSANATPAGGGAGIGGGYQGDGGTITISGGTVTAYTKSKDWGAAAIGGGGHNVNNTNPGGGEAGIILISGGTVTATGGPNSAGIGSGYHTRNSNNNGSITINGTAKVTANGGGGGAGIGGSHRSAGGNITINGAAQVTATCNDTGGAGIGGGYTCAGGNITIGGTAKVTATGGLFGGAGIGGGYNGGVAGTITIGGSAQVTAKGGDRSPGIGSGFNTGTGSASNITINGIKVSGNASTGVSAGSRGNGEGTNGTDGVKTISLGTLGNSNATGTATSGQNTRCAIGEGDY